MRLLHTSDLHLGAQWRGQSRQADQARVLDEIVDLCQVHDVDALLVTGDVFGDRVEGTLAQVMRQLLERLRPILQEGRAVFILRGNHDQLQLFGLLRYVLGELPGSERWPLVVADLPGVYRLAGRGQDLQVVALPYVRPMWLQTQPLDPEHTPEERIAGLAGLLALQVGKLAKQVSSGAPAIFAAHILVSGAQLSEGYEFESGYDRELWLAPAVLPQYTSYNALGHVHLSQEVRGAGKPTWYAGAPERLDLGEREYRPQVLLVTLPASPGGAAAVEPIPLARCTPFVRRALRGAGEVEAFCAEMAELTAGGRPDPLGEVTIADVPAVARAAVEAQVRAAAPRLRVRWALEEAAPQAPEGDWFDPHDVPAVVGRFLAARYPHEPARRVRLETALRELWGEEGAP
jgi:exonuclease SbcD